MLYGVSHHPLGHPQLLFRENKTCLEGERIWTSKEADCSKEEIDSIVKDSAALPVWLTAERAMQYYLEESGPQAAGKSVLCTPQQILIFYAVHSRVTLGD